jgi:hypothetical protein
MRKTLLHLNGKGLNLVIHPIVFVEAVNLNGLALAHVSVELKAEFKLVLSCINLFLINWSGASLACCSCV